MLLLQNDTMKKSRKNLWTLLAYSKRKRKRKIIDQFLLALWTANNYMCVSLYLRMCKQILFIHREKERKKEKERELMDDLILCVTHLSISLSFLFCCSISIFFFFYFSFCLLKFIIRMSLFSVLLPRRFGSFIKYEKNFNHSTYIFDSLPYHLEINKCKFIGRNQWNEKEKTIEPKKK